jgi:hypothetical protein
MTGIREDKAVTHSGEFAVDEPPFCRRKPF